MIIVVGDDFFDFDLSEDVLVILGLLRFYLGFFR